MFYTSTGILKYTDPDKLILEVDPGISKLYYKLIPLYKKKNRPRWPAHITLVRTGVEIPIYTQYWKMYEGEKVDFFYENIVRENQMYYWVNVFCVRLEQIRAELGLSIYSRFTIPPEGFKKCFHITIGNKK